MNGKFFHLTCVNYKRKPNNAKTTWICPNCSAANLYDTKTKIVIVSNHLHVTVSAHPTMEIEITLTSSSRLAVDTLNKSRDELVICLKTFKGFKLFLTTVGGFKNKIQNEVNRLGWRNTFSIVIMV